jgi:IS30 family transposase
MIPDSIHYPASFKEKLDFCFAMKKSHLTLEQRYQIQAYNESGKTQTEIAGLILKDKSVVSRELRRNVNEKGRYKAGYASGLSEIRKDRLKRPRKLTVEMEREIKKALTEEQWSPEQIKGRFDKEQRPMVSHERIYQLIRKDKQEGGSLYKHTRHHLKHRKRPVGGKFIVIKDKVSIDERPAIINDKGRFGDWEIDTIIGAENKGAIVTIVERQTGFLFMKKLPQGKVALGLAKVVIEMLMPYKHSVLSINSDNGTEFADHKLISKKLNAAFFFAHPYSSWERGLNENTNKLIRQYIPKKQSFEDYNEQIIKDMQHKINQRPRKKLQFNNPKHVFYTNLDTKVALAS